MSIFVYKIRHIYKCIFRALDRALFLCKEIYVNDKYFMSLAIKIAEKGRGYNKTNPLVGAVIVKDKKIIGMGYHEKFGYEHAENNAIKDALRKGFTLENSILYVTLEPCSHYGKQKPCCELIIKHKIKKVVIGSLDKNKEVNGVGILKDSGIIVKTGVLEQECNKLNKEFFYSIVEKKPYVIFKSAISLDGKIATYTKESKWITSKKSRVYGRLLRSKVDGIIVGINTVIEDNPYLTTRIIEKKNPIKIILDSKLRIKYDANVLKNKENNKTYIFTTSYADIAKIKTLEQLKGVEVFIVKKEEMGVNLNEVLKILYKKDIGSILLEGGGTLAYSFLEKNLINKIYYFIAPKLIGGANAKTSLEGQGISSIESVEKIKNVKVDIIDEDILISGDLICLQD